MNRIVFILYGLVLCGVHACFSQAVAQDAKHPAGGRVAYMLLVNGAVTDAVVKAANIEGHKSVDAPYVGTWHGFLKGMDSIQKGRLDPVEQGKIDVMLIGTLNCYPNAETWKNHLGPDDSTLAGFAALGVKNNPKFRVVWQTYLWPRGQAPKDGKKTLEVAATKKGAAGEPLKELEKLVDAINAKHGRQVVLISPVAVATMKLVEIVAEGKFPGLTDPADLWTEFNMHSNRHVLALTAFCNVATMCGVSPVGLKPDFSKVTYGGGGKGPGIQSMAGITDEQLAILQRIAWEVVSQYSHAGFSRHDAPAKANPVANPAPAVVTGVHEALQGWQTSPDLPDDPIVTDYHNYIATLPKAERPGAFEVKYFLDGKRCNAEAALVNVGGTPWPHLLTYDQTHTRNRVTNFVACR
ncbi:hypothetical protein LBMAG56_34590 [Verrucomicrobiota bacterium]|nr:hypothetical protein LBMAG56_34590 [Verrucomicrobiota bacterium]